MSAASAAPVTELPGWFAPLRALQSLADVEVYWEESAIAITGIRESGILGREVYSRQKLGVRSMGQVVEAAIADLSSPEAPLKQLVKYHGRPQEQRHRYDPETGDFVKLSPVRRRGPHLAP